MRVLYLESFTQLSDKTLLAIAQHCPLIEKIHLSGHNRAQGKIKGLALQTLAENHALAVNLRMLQLVDQNHGMDNLILRLSKARPKLWIIEGSTAGTRMSTVRLFFASIFVRSLLI